MCKIIVKELAAKTMDILEKRMLFENNRNATIKSLQ